MDKDNELLMDDFESSIVELTDDEGEVHLFDHIGTLEYKGDNYVVLVAVDDDHEEQLDEDGEGGNLVILRVVEGDDETDEYIGIDDEALLDEVFNEFMRLCEESEDSDEE